MILRPRAIPAIAFSPLLLATVSTAWADMSAAPISSASAVPALDSKDPASVPILRKFIADSVELTAKNDPNRFDKPRFLLHDDALNLDVWFMTTATNEARVVYTTVDGKNVVGGNVFSLDPTDPGGNLFSRTGRYVLAAATVLAAEGKVPTALAAQDAVAATAQQPGPSAATGGQGKAAVKGNTLVNAFDKAAFIEAGSNPAAPLLYAVVDPECGFCHAFTSSIWPHIEAGRVRVRFIVASPLAGVNGGKSKSSAVSILSAASPATAWLDHVEKRPFQLKTDQAATTAAGNSVAENDRMRVEVLDANGLSGVPFLLYRKAGAGLGFQLGILPDEVPALVGSLAPLHVGS